MDIVRAMYPEIFKVKEANKGDENRTQEDTVMRMDPKLYKAAKQGNVKYLLAEIQRNRTEEVDCQDCRSDEFFLRRTQYGNNNILHIAARAGRDAFVKEALRHFPVLSDQVNSLGDTPLLVATGFGHLQVVETLLVAAVESRANSSQRDVEEGMVDHQLLINSKQGTTAPHEALRNGHEDVALYLLEVDPKMATFDNRAGESPLFLAAESCCERFVKCILRSKRPYSTKGPEGQNALHAARNCDEVSPISQLRLLADEIISQLIEQKPDLMRQLDSRGKAAIHYAVEADQYSVLLHRMLEADNSIALIPDADSYTPLLRAASRGDLKICQDILQKCPESAEARNSQGQNALHLFKLRKRSDRKKLSTISEIWELLNIGDHEGNTPLHLAIKEHDNDKAMVFIARPDIDLGAVNKKGLTALDLCQSKWNLLNVQGLIYLLLKRRGAPHGRRPTDQDVPAGGLDLKPFLETMTVVATLLATLTFAAAFTMPGGFDSRPDNLGVAILVKKASLKVFILADGIAMCCSMAVMFLLLWVMIAEKEDVINLAYISSQVLQFAFLATLVAFASGIFAVMPPKALWVPILVGIFCWIVAFISGPGNLLLSRIYFWLREVPVVFLQILCGSRYKKGRKQDDRE